MTGILVALVTGMCVLILSPLAAFLLASAAVLGILWFTWWRSS